MTIFFKDQPLCPVAGRSLLGRAARPQLGLTHVLSPIQSATGINGTGTKAWLVGLNGQHFGEDFRLQNGTFVLGSGVHADIVLTALGISAKHAGIRIDDDQCRIMAMTTEQPAVLVNGRPVWQSELEDGDEVQIGQQRLMLRFAKKFAPGYRPNFRPRPQNPKTHISETRAHVAGWLLPQNGVHVGSDFRLLIGRNTVGRALGSSVCLSDGSLMETHLVIEAHHDRGVILFHESARDIKMQEASITGDVVINDSRQFVAGGINFLVKWF